MQWSKFRVIAQEHPWFAAWVSFECIGLMFEMSLREIVRHKISYVSFGRIFNLDLPLRKEVVRDATVHREVRDFLTLNHPDVALDQALMVAYGEEHQGKSVWNLMREQEKKGMLVKGWCWHSLLRQTTEFDPKRSDRTIVRMSFEVQMFGPGFHATPPFLPPAAPIDPYEQRAHEAYVRGEPMPPLRPSPMVGKV